MDGAFWYTPAGTEVCLLESAFAATGSKIMAGKNKGFRVDDPIILSYPTGAVVTGAIPSGKYFVLTYDETSGEMTISSTKNGSATSATAKPTKFGAETANIRFADFSPVGQTTGWTFQVSRTEIDTTTIGTKRGKYAPFRKFQVSFADGNGTATVLLNNDPYDIANRMVEDAMRWEQLGCRIKLYLSAEYDSADLIDDTASRSIAMPAVLLSASLGANVDGAQSVEIGFRPSGDVEIDMSNVAPAPATTPRVP
jgi:hypothetical protein